LTHNNNLLTWYEPDIGTADLQFVSDVIKRSFINESKISDTFAQEIQKYLGVKYALPTVMEPFLYFWY